MNENSSRAFAKLLRDEILQLMDVMGLIAEPKEELLDADIEKLIEERQAARKAKNFARADEIRNGHHTSRHERRSKMEKSIISLEDSLDSVFGLSSKDWKLYSPLTLAYLGDAVYEMVIRTICVKRTNMQTQKLHRKVTGYVSAKAQAKMMDALIGELTEEEESIYRRGRNSKPYTKAKNASMEEYLKATGFEALVGYLYLQKEYERMNALIAHGIEALQEK